jgi:hypothetical protein
MHDPLSVTHPGNKSSWSCDRLDKSSPHRLFCRCLYPAAFIIVVVAMLRSLSVPDVTGGNAIVRMIVVICLAGSLSGKQQKNISPLVLEGSIMRFANNVSAPVKKIK